ncbi:hypothetical protein QFZ24_006261 [Streptomyces phaeochromogenes]|uniref:hypothetical protein n=1 Tax=Streptomyces phaeochromogenes TaxID=1923 RepID=UPI00278D62EE|nr:hypothetical protein [Streptomyces phaeochromogenes]MDQ0952338.1 hypothetical protein [Streptomyces phaeochromogenes]
MSEVPRTECAETMNALREELQRAAEDRSAEGLPTHRADGERPLDDHPVENRPVEEPPPADDLVSEFERDPVRP